MYNKTNMSVDKNKIFSLFPDINDNVGDDISKDVSTEAIIMLGMYVKLIYNHDVFHTKLKKFYKDENIPFDIEQTKIASSFVVFNRAWSYISKINLSREEDLNAIMGYKKESLLTTLDQGIEYFESTEQYERCEKLLKIKTFKKNVENNLDI
jgi:hypothetical protein